MRLGQAAPAAATPTTLYEVPRGTAYAYISQLFICNTGAVADTCRVSIGPAGGGAEQYLYYDLLIPANDTFLLEANAEADSVFELRVGDLVTVYAANGTLSFNLLGRTK